MEKIITKLKKIKKQLEELKQKHHNEGKEEYYQINQVVERIIYRIYPERDAKALKEKLINKFWILTGNETDEYWQKSYLDKLDMAIRVINTILEESELFGFDDFKPLKEKTETTWQVGSEKTLGFFKKKKTK